MSEALKTARVQVSIAATPDVVFRSLTDQHQLEQWFAEHAVAALEEDKYSFWGMFTPDTPQPNPNTFEVRDCRPPELLRFGWRVYGADTEVEYRLTTQPDGETRVVIEQSGIPDTSRFWDLAGFWSETLDNLRAWLERDARGERFQFDLQPAGDVRQSVEIEAPPEEVFPILIQPEKVERWMITSEAEIDSRVGGEYHIHDWQQDGPAKILSLEPNRELSYSWKNQVIGYDTVVTWTLEGSAGRSRLTLVHSGFTDDEHSASYHVGWHAFLNNIKHFTEEGNTWRPPVFDEIASDQVAAR